MLAEGDTLQDVREAGGWATLQVVSDNYGHLEEQRVNTLIEQRAEKVSAKRLTDMSLTCDEIGKLRRSASRNKNNE